ncbi:MAG: hypothetical protein JXQ95_19215 [Alteromonas stellipolaris]|uniref:hypothetical protein n=1 Tax=Alteromonas stellipolaris TaxID=233316 RepID=UPI003B8B81AF
MKKVWSFVFFIAVSIYVGIQLYFATQGGPIDSKGVEYTLEEDSLLFLFHAFSYVLVAFMILSLGFWACRDFIDQKFKKFGGTYNLKTFKHVVRDILKLK